MKLKMRADLAGARYQMKQWKQWAEEKKLRVDWNCYNKECVLIHRTYQDAQMCFRRRR